MAVWTTSRSITARCRRMKSPGYTPQTARSPLRLRLPSASAASSASTTSASSDGSVANGINRPLDLRRCRYHQHASVGYIREQLYGKNFGFRNADPGHLGDAYTFATNGSINMAYALQTELNKSLTLAAWIKTTNSTRSEAFIGKYETAIGYGYVLRTTAAGNLALELAPTTPPCMEAKSRPIRPGSTTANGTTSRSPSA